MNEISKSRAALAGLTGGILNGLFGSGGGAVTVPLLEWGGTDAKKSHAMSVAIMFFISIISTFGNIFLGYSPMETVKALLPAGIIGAVTGSLLLRRTDNTILRRIFGVLLVWSGGRMLFQ